MREFVERLKACIAEHPPNYGDYDATTLVEMLYHTYTENNPLNNQAIKDGFRSMNDLLEGLSVEENNQVFHVVCDLCLEHAWLGFEAGLKVGLILMKELESYKAG